MAYQHNMKRILLCLVWVLQAHMLTASAQTSDAQTSAQQQAKFWTQQASKIDSKFQPEASRGQALFTQTFNVSSSFKSCTSCHTQHPQAEGKHAITGKAILPLAPSANPQRFTDVGKTDKWFKRNCNDVLGRECTASEKAHLLTYLLGVK